jgi:Glycosyltransferases, probably involved in cell wall biogenesis
MWYDDHALVLSLFALVVFTEVFYFIFFFSRVAFYRKKKDEETSPLYPVSIIVCAHNEEANLIKNLPTLLNQQYHRDGKPYYEVLVVNDNSEDDSYYVLQDMKKVYPHLHIVNLTQTAKLIPGKKFALSMGIKSARHPYVLLTDADCVPASEQWLSLMARGFRGGKQIVVGYGAYDEIDGVLNRTIRFETLHTAVQFLSFALAGMPYMGVGRNLAYTKQLFLDNKGFSSHHHIMSGDDDLFINQVANARNTAVVIDEKAFTYSTPKKTRVEWHFQKKRHLSTGKYYKLKHKILLGIYSMSHVLVWMLPVSFMFYPKYIFIAMALFVFRMIVFQLIFIKAAQRLKAHSLIPYLLFYDIWIVFYHLRHIPSIFTQNQARWK